MVPLASWVTCMVGLPLTQVGPSGLAGVSPPVGPLSDLDFRPIARLITLATSLAQKTLKSLILVAAVANLNLSVANVALPDIGIAFDASQTALDLVAVGYSLGLAASVLWLGALG
jgi:hypothetical protein